VNGPVLKANVVIVALVFAAMGVASVNEPVILQVGGQTAAPNSKNGAPV
jgi:hypothetical protein